MPTQRKLGRATDQRKAMLKNSGLLLYSETAGLRQPKREQRKSRLLLKS